MVIAYGGLRMGCNMYNRHLKDIYGIIPLDSAVISKVQQKFYYINELGYYMKTSLNELRRGTEPSWTRNNKYATKNVSLYLSTYDCELLTDYKGVHQKFEFVASCGHRDSSDMSHFKAKKEKICVACAISNRSICVEDYKLDFENYDCELLEVKIVKANTNFVYKARCGHITTTGVYSWKKRHKCYCNDCLGLNSGYYTQITAEKHKVEWLNLFASVYIIKCYDDNEFFYKIGITKNKLTTRFRNKKEMPYNYEVLYIYNTNLYDAIYLEDVLHELNDSFKYTPMYKFGGWTECFSELKTETFMKGVD